MNVLAGLIQQFWACFGLTGTGWCDKLFVPHPKISILALNQVFGHVEGDKVFSLGPHDNIVVGPSLTCYSLAMEL